ncbi:uncharacterized protein BKCO1_1230003 [Diplodia corticola]|uniref:DUF6594 domain-containing protein n=1 Tax=Diplodia corticola TaxID=236234 RepID=A0A1J9RM36_9PEZI|nr:uncharacterized protein BKCO1_1230003 [Diplodia corticola]OJD28661.1 hypothetical protein BKCO1_1230003 [Diplodia corticola]
MDQARNSTQVQSLNEMEEGSKTHGSTRVQRSWREYPDGYPRFDRTAARSLLYLENELGALQARLDGLEEECDLDTLTRPYLRDWDALNMAADGGDNKAADIRNLVLQIRRKVQEYHEALIRFEQALSLASPERRALKATRNVFAKDDGWRNSPEAMITDGLSKHLIENEQDLCALRKLPEPDRLTRLFEGRLAFLFREKVNGRYVDYVRHQSVERVVSAISSILAAIFLIGAVLGLYFVESQHARLGMLCGFTLAFAGSLALLTNARRQEVFATTAAYAAVLVVFLSGDFAQNTATSAASPTATAAITVTSTIFTSATVQ